MSKFKNILTTGGTAFSIIMYWALALIGITIHLWTILIAYNNSGFALALLALVMPVISEIIWMVSSWFQVGFFNPYTITIISYAILAAMAYGIFYFVAIKEDD